MEGWRDGGIIAPIVKKREGNKVTDYRRVTLMQTLYKVYTSSLMERLREEIEENILYRKIRQDLERGKG